MRTVWYDRQGAADEVLVCGELPTPEAGHGEVRVRLEASGVNPSDTYRRRGPPAMEYARVVTNSDGAGVVDQIGPGVSQHWLGKRVWLYNGQRNGRWMGTAAEYIALSADLVTELPDHVSFAEGATLGVPAMTAHRSVFVGGPVQGKTLLVTGGAGAVGHYAVQLATWAGARVIATVSSPEKAERARAGGATHIINYRQEDVAARVLDITNGVGVDHIAEVDFGGNLTATLRCLRVNGSIMIYATNGDREPKVPVRELMQNNLTVRGCRPPDNSFSLYFRGDIRRRRPMRGRRRLARLGKVSTGDCGSGAALPPRNRWFVDSLLEGTGFELWVPRETGLGSDVKVARSA